MENGYPNMRIAHVFVHAAVESQYMKEIAPVDGYGLDIQTEINLSNAYERDLAEHGLERQYTLGLFHPPCQLWCNSTQNREEYENLIPRARELAKEYCDYYIIENVSRAPLNDPVILNGGMFGKELKYERGFETNFYVEQPEFTGKYCYERSVSGISQYPCAKIKGYTASFYDCHTVTHNCVPKYYLEYILKHAPIPLPEQ